VQIDDEIIARNGVPIDRIAGLPDSAKKAEDSPPVIDLCRKNWRSRSSGKIMTRAVIRDQLADLARARPIGDKHGRIPRIPER
jgi:hypothetical protein